MQGENNKTEKINAVDFPCCREAEKPPKYVPANKTAAVFWWFEKDGLMDRVEVLNFYMFKNSFTAFREKGNAFIGKRGED